MLGATFPIFRACQALSGVALKSTKIERNDARYPQRWIIAVMRSRLHTAALRVMWLLALLAAFTSARYFLVPPRLLLTNEILALSRHHMWILVHIAGGIVAITAGLFQFVGGLRDAHPRMHAGWVMCVWVLCFWQVA